MPSSKAAQDSQVNSATEGQVLESAAIGDVQFGCDDRVQLVEQEFLFRVLKASDRPGQMIDVGAHFGGSLAPFSNAGWKVLAYEPDPENRKKLDANSRGNTNVEIVAAAVGDHEAGAVPIYASEESSGISGLTPFRDTHKEVARVPLVTLGGEIALRQIREVDLLKIDVEGYEMAVLRGMDFSRLKPRAVMVEYEDSKTKVHGYSTNDLADFLVGHGYEVFVSEWWPIVRYGVRHSWRRLRPYPCVIPSDGWGNLIGFQKSPARQTMTRGLHSSLTFPDDANKTRELLGKNRELARSAPSKGGPQTRGNGNPESSVQSAPMGPAGSTSSDREGSSVPKPRDDFADRFGPWFKGYLQRHKLVAVCTAVALVGLLLGSASLPLWNWLFSILVPVVAGTVALAVAHDFYTQVSRRARRQAASNLADAMAESAAAQAATREEMLRAVDELRRDAGEAESVLRATLVKHLTSRFDSFKNELIGRTGALAATISAVQADLDERFRAMELHVASIRNELESASQTQSQELREKILEAAEGLREELSLKIDGVQHALNLVQVEATRQVEALRSATKERDDALVQEIAQVRAKAEATEGARVAAQKVMLEELGIRYSAAVSETGRQVGALREETEGIRAVLLQRVAALGKEIEANHLLATDEREKVSRQIGDVTALIAGVKNDNELTRISMERLDADIRANTERAVERSKVAEEAANAATGSVESLRVSAGNLGSLFQRMTSANSASSIPHQRFLTSADAARLEKHWAPLFDLSISTRAISYLAHQICRIEDSVDGRLATTISAAVLRVLAIRSLKTTRIEVLEIGALFGVSAGMLVRLGAREGRKVCVTMVDPLTGYYGEANLDPQTGIPVNRSTLKNNLRRMGLTPSDYRIVEGFSHDPEVVGKLASQQFDCVLIDGDHTYEGVARDFELYEKTVRPGGLLIFDDYDTPEWPAVKSFVDDNVLKHPDWEFLGGEWRTGIFRARGAPGESRQAPPSGSVPVEHLQGRVPKSKRKGR